MPQKAILDLGDDILYMVFTITTSLDPPRPRLLHKNNNMTSVKIHLGWIILSHVCRRWRNIMVCDMPILWAQIPCAIPAALDVILSRARNAPLVLDTTADNYQYSGDRNINMGFMTKVNTIAISNIHRARHIIHNATYDNSTMPTLNWRSALHDRELPLLTALIWRGKLSSDADPLIISAPNLRSATFFGRVLFRHPSLRHLSVDCFGLDARDFLELLSQHPLLESLTCPPPSTDAYWADIPTSCRIQINSLKALSLRGEAQGILQFFRLVTLPNIRKVDIEHKKPLNPVHWPAFVERLTQIIRGLDIDTLYVNNRGVGYWTFRFCSQDALEGDLDTSRSISLQAPIAPWLEDAVDGHTFFTTMLAINQPDTIRHLVFGNLNSYTGQDSGLFVDAIRLKAHLYMSVVSMTTRSNSIAAALDILPLHTSDGVLILPNVAELFLPLANLWENWEITDGHEQTADMLRLRKDSGHPVKKIFVTGQWWSESRRIFNVDKDVDGLGKIAQYVEDVVDLRTVRCPDR